MYRNSDKLENVPQYDESYSKGICSFKNNVILTHNWIQLSFQNQLIMIHLMKNIQII